MAGTITSTPEDLYTSVREQTRRLKVELGSTALDEGRLFKINHRFVGLDSGDQLVFKVTTATDVKVVSRHIDLYEGGLEYIVDPDIGQYNIDALLTSPVITYPLNNVIGETSATTGVFGVLTGGNVIDIPDDAQFAITDLCLTSSSNGAASSDSTDDNLSIQPSGASFYIIFRHIGAGNEDSSGHYELIFEELV